MLTQAEGAVLEVVEHFKLLFRRSAGVWFLAGAAEIGDERVAVALVQYGPETVAERVEHKPVRHKSGHRYTLGSAQPAVGGSEIRRTERDGGHQTGSGNHEHVGIV